MICLAGLAYSPSATRPSLRAVSAHTTLTAIASPPEPPRPEVDLPTPTEEGGPLASLLPLSLLLESQEADRSKDALVGEDAGRFALKNERWGDVAILPAQVTGGAVEAGRGWLQFCAAVGTILSALAVLWIYSPTGYGDDFVAGLEALCGGNSHLVTLCFGLLFPLVHSGLASLRPWARQFTGERLWRVIFASASLPLAYSWIVYYISHVHDGVTFWNLQANPAAHAVAWSSSWKVPSALFDDSAPSARPVAPTAQTAPTGHPRAPPELLGSWPWPQELASGRPKSRCCCCSRLQVEHQLHLLLLPLPHRLQPQGGARRLRPSRRGFAATLPHAQCLSASARLCVGCAVQVAAVDKPQIHLWETGIIRITRHPQAVGQCLWSAAHLAMVGKPLRGRVRDRAPPARAAARAENTRTRTPPAYPPPPPPPPRRAAPWLWPGSTFCLLTNALLVAHHLFACWNGDRRLHAEHGSLVQTASDRAPPASLDRLKAQAAPTQPRRPPHQLGSVQRPKQPASAHRKV